MLRKSIWVKIFGLGVLLCLPGYVLGGQLKAHERSPIYGYRVVNIYPHDSQAYTQGLIYQNGYLFESTGRKGRSSVRKVKLETGEVVQERRLDARYWAEGLTDWKNRLIQLTWHGKVAFVYDHASFCLRRTFLYSGEGWGLTHDGTQLIMSDGSSTLRLLDPETFQEKGQLTVRDGSIPVHRLNELEYVRGKIYANVWHTDRIAMISLESGRVLGWLDLTNLLPQGYKKMDHRDAVLNGIAYDAENDRLFVTGKLWPLLFAIEVIRH